VIVYKLFILNCRSVHLLCAPGRRRSEVDKQRLPLTTLINVNLVILKRFFTLGEATIGLFFVSCSQIQLFSLSAHCYCY
jgi:hypothetical protein